MQPWRVMRSKEIRKAKLTGRIRKGLRQFVRHAKRGNDLKPYVSTGILKANSKDLMFYDWGVYHFHLGTEPDKRGFMERTNDLLFAIADRDLGVMYLLDVHPHEGGFTNRDLLRIIEANWPEILDRYTLHDVSPSYSDLTDDEVAMLRKGGVTVVLGTPGGRTLAPMGGGITTAKTSTRDVIIAGQLVLRVRRAQEKFAAGLLSIERYFEREHGQSTHELSFRARLDEENTIRIVETRTGIQTWHEREGWLIQTMQIDL